MKRSYKKYFHLLLSLLFTCSLFQCAEQKGNKIPVTTSSEKARSYFEKGRDLQEKIRINEAYENFRKALREDPDFALAHLYSALTAPSTDVRLRELEAADSLKDRVTEGERLQILGMEAIMKDSYEKQQEYYKKLVELYPEDERSHYLLGTSYFTQQDYNLAIGEYRRAVEINPDFSTVYNQLGYAHKYLGNYQEAEEAFKIYTQMISDNPNPYDSYAELQMKMGNFEKSISLYEKALKIDPEFFNSYIGIATNLNFMGKQIEARQILKEALRKTDTEDQERTLNYALIVSYVDEGKYDSARTTLKNLLDKGIGAGRSIDAMTILGRINEETGKLEKAQKDYRDAYELIEQSPYPQDIKDRLRNNYVYHQASLSIRKGNLDEAKILTEEFGEEARAKQNRHQLWSYYELRGRIAFAEKRYLEALGEYRRANLQNPYNLFRMALAYREMGDIAKAREYLRNTVNHNTFNNLDYAFIRHRAKEMLGKL